MALIFWAGSVLPGCGAGLTGGSIPPGQTRVAGIVVRGDDPSQVLSGAQLRFVPLTSTRQGTNLGGNDTPPAPPDFGNQGNSGGTGSGTVIPVDNEVAGTLYTSTYGNGSFEVLGVKAGLNQVVVTPPSNVGLQSAAYTIDVPNGGQVWMLCAPLPSTVNLTGLTGFTVQPERINATVGGSVQLVVHRLGGSPPAIAPSYLLTGGIGVVNPQGKFAATNAGSGVLTVVLGPYATNLPVSVAAVQQNR